jgi:hypothetical protein
MPNIHEIIRDHVSLSTSCVDRLYVNGYVPKLQTSGQILHARPPPEAHPIAGRAATDP